MKKIVLIFLMIFTLVGCGNVEDDFPKELASWDGNYIYYLNYRSKTTGEDSEVLFSEFNYKDNIYKIFEVSDKALTDNKIFYVVCGEFENSFMSAIVSYNLDTKDVEYLYFSGDVPKLVYCEDGFVCFYNSYGRYYLDANTKEIIEIGNIIPGCGTYKIIDNYLCFASFKDLKYYKIMYINCDYYVELFSNNYLLIKLKRDGHYYQGLYVYDIFNRMPVKLVSVDENQYFMDVDNYIIKGEKKKFSCASNPDGYEELVVNSKLYKINFGYPTTLEELYEFKKDREYSINEIDHKNVLRLKESYVKKKFLFFDSRLKKKSVYFDLNKNEFNTFYRPFNETVVNRGITCGDYNYYCDRITKGLRTIGFNVLRYDNINETEEVIQFYLLDEELYENAQCRYSEKLFDEYNYTSYFNDSFILNR